MKRNEQNQMKVAEKNKQENERQKTEGKIKSKKEK